MAPPQPADPVTAVMGPADILALLVEDPAAGIRAAADLREQRARAATPGPYIPFYGGHLRGQPGDVAGVEQGPAEPGEPWPAVVICDTGGLNRPVQAQANAEHIAAEANSAHALAAVHRWRGVVKRHGGQERFGPGSERECGTCVGSFAYEEGADWPCPDLIDTVAEVRAYLGEPIPASQREEPRP